MAISFPTSSYPTRYDHIPTGWKNLPSKSEIDIARHDHMVAANLAAQGRRAFVMAIAGLRGANLRRTSAAANTAVERRIRRGVAMKALNRARGALIRAERARLEAAATLAFLIDNPTRLAA